MGVRAPTGSVLCGLASGQARDMGPQQGWSAGLTREVVPRALRRARKALPRWLAWFPAIGLLAMRGVSAGTGQGGSMRPAPRVQALLFSGSGPRGQVTDGSKVLGPGALGPLECQSLVCCSLG